MPRTSVLQMADPHLYAIRMIASNIRKTDDPAGYQLETARTNLFRALRSESYTEAWDWLNTLDVGLGCLEADDHPAKEHVFRALKALREILETETEEVPENDQ